MDAVVKSLEDWAAGQSGAEIPRDIMHALKAATSGFSGTSEPAPAALAELEAGTTNSEVESSLNTSPSLSPGSSSASVEDKDANNNL